MIEQTRTFKHIVKIHTDTADYYQRCATITTEEDLEELFHELSQSRIKMANSLLSVLPEKERRNFWRVRDALSYLQRIWYHMKVALIVNDRAKLLKYCHKTELDTIHAYQKALEKGNDDTTGELFRRTVAHQQQLKEMINRIDAMPEKRLLKKNMAA